MKDLHSEYHELLDLAAQKLPSTVIINADCKIVFMNQSYCRFLGVDYEDAIGKHVADVIPGTLMPEIIKTRRGDDNSLMEMYDHINNEMTNILCKRIPLIKDNKVVGAVGIVTIDQMSEIKRLNIELERIRQENNGFRKAIAQLSAAQGFDVNATIIGTSKSMRECKSLIEQFAPSDLPILLTGETGTGKEVFAKSIHKLSNRSPKNMVKVNCAAIPTELFESELFGYEPGAFTGARQKGKVGLFEMADHGTLLLDEIGEMPICMQPKLLRAIQEQCITRIGGTREHKIDVRVLASTNKNLKELISQGLFREDLYYRINSVEIEIPPLREHLSDLFDLCTYFIDAVNEKYGIHTKGIDNEVIGLFCSYCWPGNIRELKHTIERLSYLNPNSIITRQDCDFMEKKVMERDLASRSGNDVEHLSLQSMKESIEEEAIVQALEKAFGNKTKAARILGIDRSVLYDKIKKYNIEAVQ